MADYQERFFDSEDGLRLFYRRWLVDQPKGLVAILHGFAEHSGRYEQVAGDLCGAGWSVATFDCRGHGQSGGRRAHVDRFSEYLTDVGSFLDEVQRDGFTNRPILLGHSQGGLIAALFAERDGDRLNGLVLSSPFLALAMSVPAVKAWAGKVLSSIMPTLAMKTGLDPANLSHDQKVVAEYAADPLVSRIATARWFTEMLSAQDSVIEDAPKISLPLLVLQAGDDRICSSLVNKRFFDVAGSQDKTYKLYEGLYHEVLNEVGREQVVGDLCSWLDGHSAT